MNMWGIIPAAGLGSRIQPLACSKELLPVGSRTDQDGEKPKAVSEYVLERMLAAGADKVCFVIAPGKSDIVKYYGSGSSEAQICYVVQPSALGLCDAIFRALPLVRPEEPVLVGLPDTVWFPLDGYRVLDLSELSFLLFPVEQPELFDAVVMDAGGHVQEIQVKQRGATSNWVWGAFAMPGRVLGELHALWCEREPRDQYVGTLVNEYIARGGRAFGVPAGTAYHDVGTLEGYRLAITSLGRERAGAEKSLTLPEAARASNL
jgi:dTDP-glucose pyrophosphorylase